MTDREQLAARIEVAGGPDRELDAAIAVAVRYFPKGVGLVWQDELRANSPERGRVECCTNLGTGGPHYSAPHYTASLDAAMMLVPEGYSWRVGRFDDGSGHAAVAENDGFMCVEDPDEWFWECESAATPALALSAAAIRAGGA